MRAGRKKGGRGVVGWVRANGLSQVGGTNSKHNAKKNICVGFGGGALADNNVFSVTESSRRLSILRY